MSKTIADWLKRIVGHEGGYSNRDPNDDPGGETKWGISKRSYPHLDIKNITVEDAEKIYIKDFINPLKLFNFHPALAFQLLDFAVNSGPRTAIKQLQEALGVPADGVAGPVTYAAMQKYSPAELAMLLIAERLEFMVSLPNWPVNSAGWTRRMAKNLRHAVEDI